MLSWGYPGVCAVAEWKKEAGNETRTRRKRGLLVVEGVEKTCLPLRIPPRVS